MTMRLDAAFLRQLDDLLAEYDALRRKSKRNDLSDLPNTDTIRFITRARAAIPRITGHSSLYTRQCEEIVANKISYPGDRVNSLVGVIRSLHTDLKAGYLKTMNELIRGELFGDFLEMAEHLADQGYKDAAAVIAGSTLEAHLRSLCEGATISAETPEGKSKKTDTLNAELAKAEKYSKLDQKSVTSWLDLRNNAAHGHYDKYTKEQVIFMITSA
jgi:hypothetical protein